MKLSEHVTRFTTGERPVGTLLDDDTVLAQAVAATRYYAAYAGLAAGDDPVSRDTDVTDGEWSVVRPLFVLYVERETALQIEASRIMSVDSFGRSSSEVAADVTAMEAELPVRAFCQPIVTV